MPEPTSGAWSNCIRVDDMVFITGITSTSPDGSVVEGANEYEQTTIIFTKIRQLLEAAGSSMSDLVKHTTWVTNIREREQVWRARKQFLSGDPPVGALIEVQRLARPEMLVEVEAIALVQRRPRARQPRR